MLKRALCLWMVVLALVVMVQPVMAGRTWVINPIEVNRGNGTTQPIHDADHCALSMRSGATWPVVTYNNGDNYIHAAMFTPAGWIDIRVAPFQFSNLIDAAVSPSGATAGFAFADGTYTALNQGQWQVSSFGPPSHSYSLDYQQNNKAAVLYDDGWSGLKLATQGTSGWNHQQVANPLLPYIPAQSCALAYDSSNNPTIAFADGVALWSGHKNGSDWYFSEITTQGAFAENMALVNTSNNTPNKPNDIPWLVYATGPELRYATLDIQHQHWETGLLAITNSSWGFSLEADHQGGVGVAYVDNSGHLTYKYNDGINGWVDTSIIDDAQGWGEVGLGFDYDNNPVICYTNGMGELSLAYDPVMVPEPVSLSLLALGGLALRRRRSLK